MKIEQITEGKDSAALHTVNARFAALHRDLVNIVTDAQAQDMLHPIELLQKLEELVGTYDVDRRMSNRAFSGMEESKELNETSSEQYERMLDQAGELGEHIASNVILDDHTESWGIGADRSNPREITTIVNKHLAVAIKRMKMVAHRYVERRLRND